MSAPAGPAPPRRAAALPPPVAAAPRRPRGGRASRDAPTARRSPAEVPGDTPESVELVGMRNVLEMAAPHLRAGGGETGPAFFPGAGPTGQAAEFGPLDDVVMGGVSESRMSPTSAAGTPAFTGVVSEANNGGFCSIRCRSFEPKLDFGAYEGVELRVRGDGQRYKFCVRTDAGWDSLQYCSSFDTVAGEWQDVRIRFAEMLPVFRARVVPDCPPLDPRGISSVQLMLSKFEYDGQLNPSFRPGPFELPVERIAPFSSAPLTPRVVHVSSAGVTRWNRPGIDVAQEPPAVGMNDALGGLLTYKLAGEDAIRASGLPYAIVRPCALTEEPAGAELLVDQGDTIKGKISREDVADLVVHCLGSPDVANVTFEVKSTLPFSEPFVPPEGGPPERDWSGILWGLEAGVTGKTVDGVYTGRQVEAEALQRA